MPASLEQWFDVLEELTALHQGQSLPARAVYKACGLSSRADRRRPQDVEDVRRIMQILGWSFRHSATRPAFVEKEEQRIVAVIGRDHGRPQLTDRQQHALRIIRQTWEENETWAIGVPASLVASEMRLQGSQACGAALRLLNALVTKGYAEKMMISHKVSGRLALYRPL